MAFLGVRFFTTAITLILASLVTASCGSDDVQQENGSDSQAIRRSVDSRIALVSVMFKQTIGAESNILACGYEVNLDADPESRVKPLNARAYSSQIAFFERKLLEAVGGVVAVGGTSLGALMTVGGVVIAPAFPPAAYTILPGLALLGASSITGGAMLASASNRLSKANAVEITLVRMGDADLDHVQPIFYDDYREWISQSGNSLHFCSREKVAFLSTLVGAQ